MAGSVIEGNNQETSTLQIVPCFTTKIECGAAQVFTA